MCLCQRVALIASTPSFLDASYLRGNFGSDMTQGQALTVCQQLVSSNTIDKACLVNCNIMLHWIKASSGMDAMVCMKAVEEAQLVEAGDIMVKETDKK